MIHNFCTSPAARHSIWQVEIPRWQLDARDSRMEDSPEEAILRTLILRPASLDKEPGPKPQTELANNAHNELKIGIGHPNACGLFGASGKS